MPIDNSPTERKFQKVTKLRMNMLFAGSERLGTHRDAFGLTLDQMTPAAFKNTPPDG